MLMSNATQGYAISNLGLTVAAIIVSALCVVAWVYVCSKNDVYGLASFVLSLAAVLLLLMLSATSS